MTSFGTSPLPGFAGGLPEEPPDFPRAQTCAGALPNHAHPDVAQEWERSGLSRRLSHHDVEALEVPDCTLLQSHVAFARKLAEIEGTQVRSPADGVEAMVMDVLVHRMREFVHEAARLDVFSEEQRLLVPHRVYMPPRLLDVRESETGDRMAPQVMESPLKVVIPGRDGSRLFMFVTSLLNTNGDPLICYSDADTNWMHLHALPQDEREGHEGPARLSTLMRVSYTLMPGEDMGAFLRHSGARKFLVAPIYSPESFQFEVAEVLRLGASMYNASHTRPYLAEVIRFAIASKENDIAFKEALKVHAPPPTERVGVHDIAIHDIRPAVLDSDRPVKHPVIEVDCYCGSTAVGYFPGTYQVYLLHDTPGAKREGARGSNEAQFHVKKLVERGGRSEFL